MADQSGGEGWWRASDGKWYPPEQHADYQPQAPAAEADAAAGPTAEASTANLSLKRWWPFMAVVIAALVVVVFALVSGGSNEASTVTAGEGATATPAPTEESEAPAVEPEATTTPEPTVTSEPTMTPEPTVTPEPAATATPAPEGLTFALSGSEFEVRLDLILGVASNWPNLGPDTFAAVLEDGERVAYRSGVSGTDGGDKETGLESVALYSDTGLDAPLESLVTIASLLSPDFDEVTAWGTAFSTHILLELTNLAPGLSEFDAPPYLSLTVDATTDAGTLYVFQPYGSPPVSLELYAALSTFEPN